MDRTNFEIQFAPLQGFTELLYRNAHHRIFGGVDTYYTPFVRIERGTFRNKDLRDIAAEQNSCPLVPQMIASSAEEINRLTDLFLEKGHSSADLNLGCPFPLIANKKKGAGILPYPELIEELISTINQRSEMRFSLKTRLGWDSKEELLKVMPLLNESNLTTIGVHARYGKQQYKGTVDMDAFQEIYDNCKKPLIYNGDIQSTSDIDGILEKFPLLKGVMIGRGLLANPAMAIEWKSNNNWTSKELYTKIAELHAELYEIYLKELSGEHQVLTKMQTFWEYLLPEGNKKLKKKIQKTNKLTAYNGYAKELLNSY
ncbi:MAG: tRNA-dihydrouridine synthase family protein [Bacteroidales bacterium]